MKYSVLDVFSDQPFGGNQLGFIPDASGLSDELLQPIATEFGYSETVFVYPPENSNHTAKIRIFTPVKEVPFAGHPLIGAAVALGEMGYGPDLLIELKIGLMPATVSGNAASFTTSVPLDVMETPPLDLIARTIGLRMDKIRTQTHQPTMASLGLPFNLVELTDRQALSDAAFNMDAMHEGLAAYPQSEDFATYIYTREDTTIHARMFAPLDGIPEDPATGSASATITAFLSQLQGAPLSLTLHQGHEMGRPSLIQTQTDGTSVKVQGTAVTTMRGEFLLP